MKIYLDADPHKTNNNNKITGEIHTNITTDDIILLGHDIYFGSSLIVKNQGDNNTLTVDKQYTLYGKDDIATELSGEDCFNKIKFLASYSGVIISYHAYGDYIKSDIINKITTDVEDVKSGVNANTEDIGKLENDKVNKSGDTMTGGLSMDNNGINSVGVLADVAAIVAKNNNILIKGQIELDANHGQPIYNIKNVGSPVNNSDAANKQYVDTKVETSNSTYTYETETEYEADKNNIPVGARVIKLYEYPDNLAGFMVVPDYNNYTSIPALSALNTEYVVQQTGYIQGWARVTSGAVNELVSIVVGSSSSSNKRSISASNPSSAVGARIEVTAWFSVKKGDIVYFGYTGTGTLVTCAGVFVNPRLVAKELPVVVEKNGSYSLDEIKTADTWIDGKPIYKIVKQVTYTTDTTANTATVITGLKVDTLVKSNIVALQITSSFDGKNGFTSGGTISQGGTTGNVGTAMTINKAGEDIRITNFDSTARSWTMYLALEYTKTTN